ncbi:response regulator [Thioflexithrix psekupsensis]|uniref:histidine kinase n=1 Tax=Thioflexithrix psekupsensis TaxID=1570016 RepID=A0A251X602_9GAMM|nr:response regulator [Thioflexithrix psekupsensis]OUD12572.1 hypothetical protein TPSD3_15930 [Thioflexithrix psekupsensis]
MMSSATKTVKAHILVIDDKPANLELLQRVLERRGFGVTVANGHQTAFALLESWYPDLILLDIMMPDLDGYQVCEWLKNNPNTADIPVIFLSALTDMLDKIKGFSAGGVDYITKPFQIAEVMARVETHLKIAQLQQSLRVHNQRLESEIIQREKTEQALAKNQRYLSTLISNLPGVVYQRYNDKQWTMEFISEGCLALTGYSADEFMSNSEFSLSQLIPSTYHESLWQTIQLALLEHRPFQLMYPLQHKDGSQRWLWEQGQGIFHHNGQLETLEGFIQDITHQKQAKDALAQTQQHLMIALETIPDGFVYYDSEDKLFFCNDHFRRLYKKIEQHLQSGVSFSTFLQAGLNGNLYELGNVPSALWLQRRLNRHQQGGCYEQLLCSGRWLEITERRTQDGGYVGLHSDMTERKINESYLKQLNQKLLFFIHQTPLAYIEWNTELFITHWNAAAERIFGYRAEEVLNKPLSNFIVSLPENNYQESCLMMNSNCLIVNQTKDNYEIICEWYNTPLIGEKGEVVGFAALAQDVTERQQTEKALKQAKEQAEVANRAKTAFLANMSHELRTPLNGVLGCAQILLRDQTLSDKQRQSIGIIHRSGEHLLMLINDLLDFSRIESGRLQLNIASLRLDQLLQDIADFFILRCREKQLQFQYNANAILKRELVVEADARRLRQILINLLSNAVKFTEKGQIGLNVNYHEGLFHFNIADTGCGMEAEFLRRIFSSFQRGQHHLEGAGLGLAISHRLVDLMGGELRVETQVEQGTRFHFALALPIIQSGFNSSAKIIGYVHPHEKPIHILIITDNVDIHKQLYNLLRPLGFKLEQANSGREGLIKAEQFLPDVILMNSHLPEISGFHCVRYLRKNPSFSQTVIMMFSTVSLEENEEMASKALAEGCTCFLKEITGEGILLDALAEYCDLTWQFFEPSPLSFAQQESSDGELTCFLPVAVLQKLLEQALIGNIKAISLQLETLFPLYPESNVFLKRVEELTQNLQVTKLKNLLQNVLARVEKES